MSNFPERWRASMQDNYGTPPITLVRGVGARVWDETGKEYLDLLAGIAVNALGHAHPEVVAAVTAQVATLGHTSNLAITEPALELAERLLVLLGQGRRDRGRVFFCNSGAEANEAAFKLTRLTGRTRVVAAERSFHGRTMGSLALTGQPAKADPFRPLPGDVAFVPYGDIEALAGAVGDRTAAIFLEPIMGEAGVVVPPPGYLAAAQEVAGSRGALLVLDEVQTGIGRTGRWFAHQDPTGRGLQPDVVTLAKGLGGGLPIGAMVAFGAAGELFAPGSHGSTFGGNPVSCAAALAVLRTIEQQGLLVRAQACGERLRIGLLACPGVSTVRGAGLLLGVVLAKPVAMEVAALARKEGLIVNAPAADVIRLAPPLIISDAQVDLAVQVLTSMITAAVEEGQAGPL